MASLGAACPQVLSLIISLSVQDEAQVIPAAIEPDLAGRIIAATERLAEANGAVADAAEAVRDALGVVHRLSLSSIPVGPIPDGPILIIPFPPGPGPFPVDDGPIIPRHTLIEEYINEQAVAAEFLLAAQKRLDEAIFALGVAQQAVQTEIEAAEESAAQALAPFLILPDDADGMDLRAAINQALNSPIGIDQGFANLLSAYKFAAETLSQADDVIAKFTVEQSSEVTVATLNLAQTIEAARDAYYQSEKEADVLDTIAEARDDLADALDEHEESADDLSGLLKGLDEGELTTEVAYAVEEAEDTLGDARRVSTLGSKDLDAANQALNDYDTTMKKLEKVLAQYKDDEKDGETIETKHQSITQDAAPVTLDESPTVTVSTDASASASGESPSTDTSTSTESSTSSDSSSSSDTSSSSDSSASSDSSSSEAPSSDTSSAGDTTGDTGA